MGTAGVWAVDLDCMSRAMRTSEKASSSEARWFPPGLSVFVLLALLSATPGGGGLELAPASGRVAAGTCVMPVVIAFREPEEPSAWSRDALPGGASVVRCAQRVVVTPPVRDALLSLPPPACV